ncbi:hypothetical protein [Shewanella aestuarii]|uniref:Tetratricopeptide repeat protein n=1 Tax=Shewanella aestuarii TaxID=1028752 RepID=A0A6G9QFY8_9GAMM|nr:hypothetical protein [Shewanella aestuarii]QIR13386.1 hypothetical protein HBH39_01825 [Shewanella aestuarii]
MKASKLTSVTKLASALVLLTTSTVALADVADNTAYKMVLIEDVPGVNELQSGNIIEGLNETLSASKLEVDSFSRNINLCVGYTKLSEIEKAEQACTAAVKSARIDSTMGEMRAYAYNNRGVAKLMAKDNLGALEDFRRAAKVTSNSIYQHNLTRLEAALNSTDNGIL